MEKNRMLHTTLKYAWFLRKKIQFLSLFEKTFPCKYFKLNKMLVQ